MATDVERLQLTMSADIRALERAMTKALAASDKAGDGIERRFDRLDKNLQGKFGKLGDALKTALAGVAVGAVVKDLLKLADVYTSITNQLRSARDVLGDTDAAQKRLVNIAVDSNTDLEALAAILGAAARAARDLGRSGDDVFAFTEAVGKGAGIANTGASAVAGALTQLGQAVASPIAQLGEFNSLVEGTPRLAQAFADGIPAAEGSVSKLRKLIGSGQVSGSQLFEGLLTQLPVLRREFAEADVTVGEAFVNLKTRITEYVGEANQATNVTRTLVPLINYLADSVDDFADVAVVALVAIAGALTGIGTGATLAAIGNAARGITGAKVAMAATGVSAIQLAGANGTLTLSQREVINSSRNATAATTLFATASRLGAGAVGVLRLALAVVGGPIGLLGAGVALLAFELSTSNDEMRRKARVTKELSPQIDKIRELTQQLATAEGEHAKALEKSRKEEVKALITRARMAQANLVLAESTLKLREAELFKNRSFTELSQLGDETQFGIIAGLAMEEGRIEKSRKDLVELRAQINALLLEMQAANQAAAMSRQRPRRRDGAATEDAADAYAEQTQRIEEALDAADIAAREADDALMDAFDAADDVRRALRDDAESFLDRLPGSTRAAYRELYALRELIAAGIFVELGQEQAAAEAQARILEDIAFQAGRATEALSQLEKVKGLTPEDAARAAARIKRAAREGAARRDEDEEPGPLFREEEIRDDLKSALYEAMKSGQYADVFRERIADALDRAAQRGLDRFVDGVFDAVGGLLSEIGKGRQNTAGGKNGGGIWGALIKGVLEGVFGGGRASGGPISANRMYLTGERGPELIVPSNAGFVIPTNVLAALQSSPRAVSLTQRTEVKVAYSIDLSGANGDATIRDIARREARRGVGEALRIANKQAPQRSMQYQKLGT